MIRILIADDEQAARQRLKRLLARMPEASVVGEAADGSAALALVGQERPDVLFLDIEMPEATGFDVARVVAAAHPAPLVVFVTAFDQYAVRAFEVHATDYLLKPISEERLATTWQRVRDRLRTGEDRSAQLLAALEDLRKERRPGHRERILVTTNGRTMILPAQDVEWVEAAANYVKLHVGPAVHMLRESMQNFEAQLDPERFMRIHRSAIVNVDHIREIQPWFSGDQIIILKSGAKVKLSRTYRRSFEERFGVRDSGQSPKMEDSPRHLATRV